MTYSDILWQQAIILPVRLSDLLDLSADTWFVIAAAVTLWAYMILAPERKPSES